MHRRLRGISTCSRLAGFSLIEILVVASIVAILAAFLLGGVKTVRSVAVNVKCASNLRQLHIAMLSWSEDQQGELMCASGGNVWRWYRDIMPYVTHNPGGWNNSQEIVTEARSVSTCPDFLGVISDPLNAQVEWDSRGYAINARPLAPQDWGHTMADWGWWGGAGAPAKTFRVSQIDRTSTRFLFSDSNWGVLVGNNWFDDWKGMLLSGVTDTPSRYGYYVAGPYEVRHRGQRNLVFFDGHTASQTIQGEGSGWYLAP